MSTNEDSARATDEGKQEEPTRDGIRSWVDYQGHVPRTLQMTTPEMQGGGGLADFLRGLGVALSEAAQDVTICAICDVDWPCKHALRAERDSSEDAVRDRGDRLRAAGLAVDDGPQPFHPDKQTPRGRAVMALQQHILRQTYQDAAQEVSQITNLIVWHPTCNDGCHGHHHNEHLLVEQPCCEHHGMMRIAALLGNSYGVAYLSHAPVADDQQESVRRAYSERLFTTVGFANGLGDPATPEDAFKLLAVSVQFYANTPLTQYRAMAAQLEAKYEEEDLAAARAEGQQSGGCDAPA